MEYILIISTINFTLLADFKLGLLITFNLGLQVGLSLWLLRTALGCYDNRHQINFHLFPLREKGKKQSDVYDYDIDILFFPVVLGKKSDIYGL